MKYTRHQKIIPYQTVINVRNKLKLLRSWEKPLRLHLDYFHQKPALSQAMIVDGYYVQGLIVDDFFIEFLTALTDLEKEIELMTTARAIKPIPYTE